MQALHFSHVFVHQLLTSKTGLQRPAARYDGIGKIGGGYGFLVSMVSRVVSRCAWLPSWGPWLPKFVPCYLKWSLVDWVVVVDGVV